MANPSSADRDPLDRLAEEFVARFRAGERPSLTEYAERLPDRADEVRDLFPALVEMEQLKPVTADQTGGYTPSVGPSDPAQLGEFRILRRIGQGGMGVVYEAVQESLGRHVALKLLPAEALLDPKRLERFRREAKAAAKLHHTNIVPVFGTGEADGRHFYAMQFIAGHPLDAVIDEVKRLKGRPTDTPASPRAVSDVAHALMTGTFAPAPGDDSRSRDRERPAEAAPVADASGSDAKSSAFSGGGHSYWATVARVGAQVADALAYAHQQGIQHRDIKPANLLLDLRGTVWVTDFGLAKASDADNDLTQMGDIVGTLRYLAPERFEGTGDHRADIYALGLTLYELLTLTPAFAGDNRAKLVEQAVAANPPRPRAINPAIPKDLETIVLKAIARDPAMRYQTAGELADDLRRYQEDRPIRARRASGAEMAWRWCRRNPAVAGLLTAVLLVFAGGAGVSWHFAREAERKEKEAGVARDEAVASSEQLRRTNYAVSMNLIQSAWDANDVGRVIDLLDRQRPLPGETDLRGLEWHYWRRLCHGERRTIQVPGTLAHRRAVLSPDGTRFAGVVQEGGHLEVRVWNTATGELLLRLPGPDLPRVLDEVYDKVAFSPDGTRLAAFLTGSGGNTADLIKSDGELFVWNCEDRHVLFRRTIPASAVPGLSFRFSPDGNSLGAIIRTSEPPNFLRQVCDLIVWDLARNTERLRVKHDETRHATQFYGLSFSPDGKRLVTSEWSGPETDPTSDTNYTIKVIEIDEQRTVLKLPDMTGFAYFLQFSPDGTQIAAASCKKGVGGEIQIYEVATLQKTRWWKTDVGWDTRVTFSSDGKRLASCGLGGAVDVWNVGAGELTQTLKGHTNPVSDVVFSGNDKVLISADSAGTIKNWDLAPRELPPVQQDAPDALIVAAVTPDLSRVAICKSSIATLPPETPCPQQVIRILDRSNRETGRIKVQAEIVNCLEFSPDGRWLAGIIVSQRECTCRVVVWDVTTRQPPRSFEGLTGKGFCVFAGGVVFNRTGSRLLARLQSANVEKQKDLNTVKVWDTATWDELTAISGGKFAPTPDGSVNNAAADISPDGKWFAMGVTSRDGIGLLTLREAAGVKELGTIRTRGQNLHDVSISPDGKLIAATSIISKSVQVFDFATQQPLFVLKGHADPVWGVTFSPDGRRVAASSNTQGGDQIIKLWDTSSGEEVLTLRNVAGADSNWGFSSDGHHLYALNRFHRRSDNPLHVWDATPLPEGK